MKLNKIILIAFIFSGMAALIYEVVWIRPLEFVFGSTIYTVSIIFAVFMAGLALGSRLIAKYVDKIKNLPRAYALMELGIGLYGVLLLSLFGLSPDIYRAIYPLHKNFYLFEFFQFISIFILLLIPTTLMGATFPVIAKFYTKEKIGKGIGEIYSANNLGAIFGSFAAGFILIPILGIKSSIIFAGFINIFIAFLILSIVAKTFARKIIPIALLLFLALSYFGNYKILSLYSGGFYRSQYPKELVEKTGFLYYKEGLHATVAVTKDALEGARVLLINGKGQGSTAFADVRVNSLLAYLPLFLRPESKNSLVIGLGTGTTPGHLAQSTQVTTVEIEPAILEAAEYFNVLNLNVLENPNHNLIITDGRNYLLKSKERFDLIVPEPSDPWQSFSTNLFSKEFFELAKKHLHEYGIYVQWVPIYEMSVNDFKSFYKTFNSVFPNVVAFANLKENENFPIKLETTQIILLGSEKKLFDEKEFRENFDNLFPNYQEYLEAIWINSSDDLLNLLLFTDEQMKGYADEAEFITDDNAKLEFSTSKNVLISKPDEVISDIERYLASAQENFALEFDGVDDYALLPRINAGKEFTLEAWFYPTSASTSWMTLFKDDWKNGNLGSFYLDPVQNQVDLSWWWEEKAPLFIYNLNLNTWYYFAFVADGTTTTMYALADYRSAKVSTSTTPNFNNELKIGETDDGSFYKGQVDDVRIYNRALSLAEIEEHRQGIYKDETGLLGFWNFNEGEGNTVYDKSGNGNDGAISGASYALHPNEKISSDEGTEKIKETPVSVSESFFGSFIKKIFEWLKNLVKF